jgi:hypothetical protein
MKKIIAIALALVMCLGIMSMVAFAAAPTLNSLAIVGENIPGVGNWAPEDPTGDMTKVSDGVYEKILECPAGTNMNFKIAGNDKWDDTCNFGSATLVLGQKADLECSGGSGNMNLTFDKATKIKITVDVNPMNDGGAATILVEEVKDGGTTPTPTQPTTTKPTTTQPTTTQPTTTAKPVTSGTRVLTVMAPSSWKEVHIYTWDPNDLGEWPGSKLTKTGDVYKADIKNSMVNLIVASEQQADTTYRQTGNIALETNGKAVTVTVNDDCTYKIEYAGGSSTGGNRKPAAPAPQGTLSNYRVVGNAAWMGSWDAASNLGQMIEVSTGVYRKNFENVAPGSYELKITKDGKWDNAYGVNGQNYTFTVDTKCTITVDFKLQGNTGVIEVYGTGVPSTADISMLSVVVLLALASVTAVVLVVNKKKFI